MTIAITGATGQLGGLIIEGLKARLPHDRIIALARSPQKASGLGVQVRAFDYARPDALAQALDGVETLLLVSSNEIGQRTAQHRHVINAAREAGVSHLVYTSILHADTSPISLASEHRATEADLKASGMPATILRNGWYFENYGASIPAALANGAFIGSAGDGQLSLATRADYAEAAVTVLTDPSRQGRTYELAGDTAVTLPDLAAELSRQTGRDIPYVNLPQAEFARILKSAGVPDPFAEGLASWDVDASNGALFDNGRALSSLIGRPTTPLDQAIRAALA